MKKSRTISNVLYVLSISFMLIASFNLGCLVRITPPSNHQPHLKTQSNHQPHLKTQSNHQPHLKNQSNHQPHLKPHWPLVRSEIPLPIASQWEALRLNELWPAQGLKSNDKSGGMNLRQARRYQEIAYDEATLPSIQNVCETGFFRGGSTLFWMLLFPNATVHSFDISFPDSAVGWFNLRFPGRLVVHIGDSKNTIKSQLAHDLCDFVSIDGDHGPDGTLNDILNMVHVAKPGATIVSDDTFDCKLEANSCQECLDCPCRGNRPFCNFCSEGFQRGVSQNLIDWKGCDQYGYSDDKKYPIGSCYGVFRTSI